MNDSASGVLVTNEAVLASPSSQRRQSTSEAATSSTPPVLVMDKESMRYRVSPSLLMPIVGALEIQVFPPHD